MLALSLLTTCGLCATAIDHQQAARRPVYYAGHSSNSGHFFVVDGYQSEDFFHINWGWYGNKDGDFRLSLCNPSAKYEGGGTGDEGYSGKQYAIVGIKPATTPQHADPQMTSFFKWDGKETYQRTAADPDYSVFVEFTVSYLRDKSNDEIPLYYSDGYLLNDATPTAIRPMVNTQWSIFNGQCYDLQGRKVAHGKASGRKLAKGLYIINGKKVVVR